MPAVEEHAQERAEDGDGDEDEPRLARPEHEGEVPREHREEHGEGQVVVVNRAVLRLEERGGVGLAPLLHRRDELAVRGDDHEEDVRGHDRPEHHADLQVRGTRGEELAGGPGRERDEARADDGERDLAPRAERAAEEVVDDPGECDAGDAEGDGLSGREIGDGRIDEARLRVRVVEDDEEGEAREPGRVRLPLEPVQRLGHLRRGEPVLLGVVEAAAVDAPELPGDACGGVLRPLRRAEGEVEPDEVEGRADPRDPGGHVEHAEENVEDVSQVRVHRSLAIATSSRQPVSSSSSRVFAMRSRRTSRISRFGLPATNTTKRKPNFSS